MKHDTFSVETKWPRPKFRDGIPPGLNLAQDSTQWRNVSLDAPL